MRVYFETFVSSDQERIFTLFRFQGLGVGEVVFSPWNTQRDDHRE